MLLDDNQVAEPVLPIWCQIDAERWHRELTALQDALLLWRGKCPVPKLSIRAYQLADAAAIAAVRPDLVLQDRMVKYLKEEFAALRRAVPE